jgi:glycosyltransferase involved in cell wall biosynthesis
MRIGVARSLTDSVSGGVFQYEKVFLEALGELAGRYREELVYLCYNPTDLGTLAISGGLNYRGLPILALSKPEAKQASPETYLAQRPAMAQPLDPNDPKFNYAGAELMRQNGVDLLVLASPSLPGFTFRVPFVVPIFDLNHRLQPEFPEVSAFGEATAREHFYINSCRFATLVLVDSEVGKSHVLRFYGNLVEADRIRVMPYYPPVKDRPPPSERDLARVRAKYNLPNRYFFYPAQFWPHKNHGVIVQAIKLIAEETGEAVPVVFCGAYWTYVMAGNFKEVMAQAAKLGVGDRVRYLGSVSDEDMAALYTLSAGLVMPSFFGPTNIPPLEAWHLGRPVITSDIEGVREQMGDAALLVDPHSPQSVAAAMKRVWHDKALCAQLVERGGSRIASYDWSTFVNNVTSILDEASERVRSGRTPRYPDIVAEPSKVRST